MIARVESAVVNLIGVKSDGSTRRFIGGAAEIYARLREIDLGTTFPSSDLREKIGAAKLPQPDFTFTDLNSQDDTNVGNALTQRFEYNTEHGDAPVVIDGSNASPEEKDRITAIAKGKGIEVEILNLAETSKPLLQGLTREAINHPALFRAYVGRILQDPQLAVDEWNTYVANASNPETKNATDPFDTHHVANLGLKRVSEGDDPLRNKMKAFIKSVVATYASELQTLRSRSDIQSHANSSMNSPEAFSEALVTALLSDMVRAVWYDARGKEQTDHRRKIALEFVQAAPTNARRSKPTP